MRRKGMAPASTAIAEFLPVGPFRCQARCGAEIGHLGICDRCAKALLREECADRVRERAKDAIPPAFRWATMQAVVDAGHVSQGNVRGALEWVESHGMGYSPQTLLLRGGTHVNKSAFACALLRYEIEIDRDAMFIAAHSFSPEAESADRERAFSWARRPNLVCIDDIASVLGNAPVQSDIASRRAAALLECIRSRHNRKLRTIYTTTLRNRATQKAPEPGICEVFGEDIMARMTDPREALVINLERRT